MATKTTQQHSGYWLGRGFDAELDLADREGNTGTIIKLAAIKQAITNFVRIVTGKSIPVMYSSGRDSYTDGKRVVISASTKDKNFDSVVGLALHESSHILLTDFLFLHGYVDYKQYMVPASLQFEAAKLGIKDTTLYETIKFLMNVVEDRRIDYFIYRTAPGYRPYYEAMYDLYWHSKEIDAALRLKIKTEPTVENYVFYITNMTNKWIDANDLPGLKRILEIVDLDNIARLDNDQNAYGYVNVQSASHAHLYEMKKMPLLFQIVCQIMEVILANAKKFQAQPQQPQSGGQGQPQQGEGDDQSKEANLDMGSGESSQPSEDGDENDDEVDDDSVGDDDSDEDGDTDSDEDADDKQGNGESKDESDDTKDSDTAGDEDGDKEGDDGKDNDGKDKKPKKEKKIDENKLNKAIKRQKDFLNGDIKKAKVGKNTIQKIKALEQSGASVTDVEHSGTYGGKTKTKVLVMRKLTKEIMESGAFPFTAGAHYHRGEQGTLRLHEDYNAKQAVTDGLRAGAILAQRLSIRNQNQVTKFNRKDKGTLDKRRLHALGFDDDKVFSILRKTEFKPVFAHLTIDVSGSMTGDRFQKALMVGVALAVAAEKIDNLDIIISLRAGVDDYATVAIIYDSRVDTTAKIKSLFKYLTTNGSTPEGLVFAALMDDMLNVKSDERYFINLSDGEPCYANYGGEPAWRHTREQVNIMRNEGIKILSYFVGSGYARKSQAFSVMYGKDAAFIDVTQVPSLVGTLNRLFLQR